VKGIVLAGGSGTRLHPITLGISKQLMPVYDKPMIYYPISTLILAGIREILIITAPDDSDRFRRLLGDGAKWGVHFDYAVQENPNGLAQAFVIGAKFIGESKVALILGDNIFFGAGLGTSLQKHQKVTGATVFAHRVSNPQDYGVVEFDEFMNVTSLDEKPLHPRSSFAVPGLYFYDNRVVEYSKSLELSSRGEYEITDLNKKYLEDGTLTVEVLPRGTVWLDTGSFESLNEASNFVRTIEHRQGSKVGSPEEASWQMGLITDDQLNSLAQELSKSGYGKHLLALLPRGRG